MLPDALPQLIDTVLRLPLLEAAQLMELIQLLPDPQASAQEMLRRGWITQNQFSSLFPRMEQPPTLRGTRAIDFGGNDLPLDVDDDIWHVTPIVDKDEADCEQVAWLQPHRTPEPEALVAGRRLFGTGSIPRFRWNVLDFPDAGGKEALRQESNTDKPARLWMGWGCKGLLLLTLIIGSFFAGRKFLGAHSTVAPVAHQETSQANIPEPARFVVLQSQFVPFNVAKQFDDVLKALGQQGQPAAQMAVAKPK